VWLQGTATFVLAAAGTAVAQNTNDGPVVITPRAELKWIDFYDFQAALELEWRTNVDDVDPAGGARHRNTEHRMREILDVRTQGYVGHPNLLELDLGGRFWLEQRWLDLETEPTEFIPQFLIDWDISGLFVKETKVPFTVYTRQNTSEIDRQFGSSLENTFSEYGVRANIRSSFAPTNIQIFRREIDQRDVTVGQGFNIDQFTIQADGRVDFSLSQRLAWDAKYDDVNESGQLRTPRSFDRFESNVTHTLEFGEKRQSLLRTQARLFNESGDRDFSQIRLLPRLRLWHSPSLNSWYDYRFEWDNRPEQEQITNQATANFQYQVFDSLTMIGNAGFNLLDIPTEDFDSNELFARLDVQYLKEIPLGSLQANLNGSYSHLNQSERGTPVQITDGQNQFSPISFTLNQRNIIAGSIVITNIAGLITYTENMDYTVFDFQDSVLVQLIPGGDIMQLQLVLVDFVIGPNPGGTTDTGSLGLDFRYTFQEGYFRGLSFYTNLFHQDESRSILTEDFPENDFTDLRYGLEYNVWKLYFRAERQHRDSTLSPFDATRIEGRYTESLGRGSNVVLSALFQEIDRTAEGFRQTTATFSGQWAQRVNDQLRLTLLFQYQLSDDNVLFDSDAFEGQLDISWRYRQTEIYGQLRGSIRDSTSDVTSFQRLIFGIRREF
jgi:hypothetical protein